MQKSYRNVNYQISINLTWFCLNISPPPRSKTPEAHGKVANSLVFNGNRIDIIINFSTTKALIKILMRGILGTIPGYRTHSLWLLDKILSLRTSRLSARLQWLGAYIAKYGIGLVLKFICTTVPNSHQIIHQKHHDNDFHGKWHLNISEHTRLVNLKSESLLKVAHRVGQSRNAFW
jgi:hypothetical protein